MTIGILIIILQEPHWDLSDTGARTKCLQIGGTRLESILYVRMQPIYVWSQVGSYKSEQLVKQRHQKSGLSVRPTFLFYLAEKNSYMAVYALWSGLYCAIPGMGQVRSGICWAAELWGWVRMVRWGKVGQDVMGLMQRYTSACIPIFRYRWLKWCNISITSMYASHGTIYIGLKTQPK